MGRPSAELHHRRLETLRALPRAEVFLGRPTKTVDVQMLPEVLKKRSKKNAGC